MTTDANAVPTPPARWPIIVLTAAVVAIGVWNLSLTERLARQEAVSEELGKEVGNQGRILRRGGLPQPPGLKKPGPGGDLDAGRGSP